ncbi:MAG TPA: hypothetical protein VF550_08505 [Polyangia bacterium]
MPEGSGLSARRRYWKVTGQAVGVDWKLEAMPAHPIRSKSIIVRAVALASLFRFADLARIVHDDRVADGRAGIGQGTTTRRGRNLNLHLALPCGGSSP